MKTDKEFLIWLHERLANEFDENILLDYMYRLRTIIDTLPFNQTTKIDFDIRTVKDIQLK